MASKPDLADLLVGRDSAPMVVLEDRSATVHREILPELEALTAAARAEGIELAVASGLRDFERQLGIWNEKARGERPLLDEHERLLQPEMLSPRERVFAILRWSALPGASRHHWGCDIDVFDRAALPDGRPELRRDETGPGAVFERLHRWLDAHVERFGFYRPYDEDRGGVSPEPWHLSHAALSRRFESAYSIDLLERAVREADLELSEVVLANLPEIYGRFVVNTARIHGA